MMVWELLRHSNRSFKHTHTAFMEFVQVSLGLLVVTLYSTITDGGEHIAYRYLLQRLGKNGPNLDETAQVNFHQAIQQPGESLNDWADQVLTLANQTYGRFKVLLRPQ